MDVVSQMMTLGEHKKDLSARFIHGSWRIFYLISPSLSISPVKSFWDLQNVLVQWGWGGGGADRSLNKLSFVFPIPVCFLISKSFPLLLDVQISKDCRFVFYFKISAISASNFWHHTNNSKSKQLTQTLINKS